MFVFNNHFDFVLSRQKASKLIRSSFKIEFWSKNRHCGRRNTNKSKLLRSMLLSKREWLFSRRIKKSLVESDCVPGNI